MLHREVPFLRIGIPLCAGIICGYYIRPGIVFFIASAVIILTGFLLSIPSNKRLTNTVYGLTFVSAMFICGLFLYTREKASLSVLSPEERLYLVRLSDYPEEKERTWKMTMKLESEIAEGILVPLKGSLLVYHRKEGEMPPWIPGDRILIRCRPSAVTNRGNPYEFDYRFYMENRGVRYMAFTDSSDIFGHSVPERRKLTQRALIIRQRIIDMFRERGVSEERLALVAAITMGRKNMLDPEQKEYFIKAGIMHIMAVSGLHAMILSLFVLRILFFLKGRLRILKILIALLMLWTFAFVTGLTPSVFRATLMFSFLQAGTLMRRPVHPVNSILASAFVLIMARPSVIFDASFLLSYSAVTFIIIFFRDLCRKISFRFRIPELIWQAAAVSLIAQAGTLSLSVMLFNRFPTWFILSNIVIVPISSIVIITGCLMPLVWPLKFISYPLAKFISLVTGLTEYLTARAAALPLSTIDNIGMTAPECLLLTITMFLILRFLLVRRSMPVTLPLAAILLLVTTGTIRVIATGNTAELIVYNSAGNASIGIRSGRHLNHWSDTAQISPEAGRHASTLGLRTISHLTDDNPVVLKTGGKSIMITSTVSSTVLDKGRPDILIISGKKPVVENPLLQGGEFEAVIVSSGTSLSYRNSELIRSLQSDTLHFTSKDGAFRLRL